MSYLVLDVMAEYTDRATGNRQIRAQLIADTAADLPANSTALTWLLGSYAKAVDTGKEYYIDSGGTWILQPSNNAFDNVYTKTEMDSIINTIDTLDTKQTLSLVHLINENGKNHVKPTATTQTINGITWTVNSDGTITADGTATANSYITVQVLLADSVFDGNYYLSGCPDGGSSTTFALYVARGSYTKYDYGDGVSLSSSTDGLNKNLIAIVYNGQTVDNIVFQPMICKKVYWDITHKYMPYCPTLPELYALVRSYHP